MYIYVHIRIDTCVCIYIYTHRHETHFDLADSRKFALTHISMCVLGMACVMLQGE